MGMSIAVLGLGRFGSNLARTAYELGADLLVADRNEELVQSFADIATVAVSGDLASEKFLEALDLGSMDKVVVAAGSDLEATMMAVVVAKEQGAPYVLAKVSNDRMGTILQKLGCDEVVQPEAELGVERARVLMSDNVLNLFDVGDHFCMAEVKPQEHWIGHSLRELSLRSTEEISVVVAMKDDEVFFMSPDDLITENMRFVVVMDDSRLEKFRSTR